MIQKSKPDTPPEFSAVILPNDKQVDTLATFMVDRYNEALAHRRTLRCGTVSLDEEIRLCKDQFDGNIKNMQTVDGRDVVVNISRRKSRVLDTYLADMLVELRKQPITLTPTPIPALTAEDEEQIAFEFYKSIVEAEGTFTGGVENLPKLVEDMNSPDPDLRMAARLKYKRDVEPVMEEGIILFKTKYIAAIQKKAEDAAKNMERLIFDQFIEGGFFEALEKTNLQFTKYPFAVLRGPLVTPKVQWAWKKNKYTRTVKTQPMFVAGSVLDTYWSPDSSSPQNGTYMIIRDKYTKYQLMDWLRMPEYYIAPAIEEVLKALDQKNEDDKYIFTMAWTTRSQPEDQRTGEYIDTLTYYGKIEGWKLKEAGYSNAGNKPLEDHLVYEAEITCIYNKVIKFHVYEDPCAYKRPIHMSSMFKTEDNMFGGNMLTDIRNLELQFNDVNKWQHDNGYKTSGNVSDIDYSQLPMEQRVAYNKDIAAGRGIQLRPNTTIPRTEMGATTPLITMYPLATPNPLYPSMRATLAEEIHDYSMVTKSMEGTPVGTGANRTVRGMSMILATAQKPLQRMYRNLDTDLISPAAEALYIHNLLTSDDESIKGDAQIIAEGAQGTLAREIEKQKVIEDFNATTQALGVTQAIDDPKTKITLQVILKDAIIKYVKVLGADVDGAEQEAEIILQRMAAEQQQLAMQQAMLQQQEVSNGNPEPTATNAGGSSIPPVME